MKPSSILGATLAFTAIGPFAIGACSDGLSASDLNTNPPVSSGGNAASGGTGSSVGGAAGTASVVPTAGTGSSVGTGGDAPVAGSSSGGAAPVAGSSATGGSEPVAGSAATGGSGGTGGTGPVGPYADRSGPFKMLVLSRTAGFAHTASIETGKAMLKEIGMEQGFELAWAETDGEIDAVMNATKLAEFEIIFHLNTTGDIFDAAQQQTYQTWMLDDGAFAGVHSATDTENGWAFYSEVTGQYYNGHSIAGTQGQIQFEASALEFPAVKGLPNPWSRAEEWYNFNSYQQWSVKPGFKVLGRKASDQQPIVWTREHDNFRAFYSAIGHDAPVFKDPAVKKHITGGIMWAVRRDKLIK